MKIVVNGQQREVADGTTALAVVTEHGESQPRRGVAVAVNGAVVPRARLGETGLQEGATVEIVTAVQGG